EQVRALVRVEEQRPGDGLEHLRGSVDVAALLEPRVPGDPDPGELRHLLAPQARSTAAPRGRQTHLIRRDPLPAPAEERGELAAADAVSVGPGGWDRGSHEPSIANV